MRIVKIAIADDHVLFRKGIAALLQAVPQFDVLVEAGNGADLLRRVRSTPVDVVLMDMEMPEMDGIAATKQLKAEMPQLRVVVCSAYNEDSLILDAVESGARGYLLKDSHPDELIDAIMTVVENGFCFNSNISRVLLRRVVEKENFQSHFHPQPQLSDRELEVLQLICKELTNTEIGDKLCLSPRTIESYRKNMMEKIGARNTVGLVLYAFKHKLVTDHSPA